MTLFVGNLVYKSDMMLGIFNMIIRQNKNNVTLPTIKIRTNSISKKAEAVNAKIKN